nr:tRNA (guanosine(37)-N1)-methyltransferase TrmD [Desulfobulbaceae bacterium]
MRIDILTIFPDLLASPLEESILKRAQESGALEVAAHNIRDFAVDKHSMTDDRPFGGGEGMVMKPEPIVAALQHVDNLHPGGFVVQMTPQGRLYNQNVAQEYAKKDHIILLCGRYEGIDQRVSAYVDDEISIGDFILTGGELAALIVVDSITRLLPDVLGCEDSVDNDTFSRGLLKHPQYTRPRSFAGVDVPDVLLSGDHKKIEEWRLLESVKRTIERRPELLKEVTFSKKEKKLLASSGIAGQLTLLDTKI